MSKKMNSAAREPLKTVSDLSTLLRKKNKSLKLACKLMSHWIRRGKARTESRSLSRRWEELTASPAYCLSSPQYKKKLLYHLGDRNCTQYQNFFWQSPKNNALSTANRGKTPSPLSTVSFGAGIFPRPAPPLASLRPERRCSPCSIPNAAARLASP